MTRKRQSKARAFARARDGSVPARGSSRGLSTEPATGNFEGESDSGSDGPDLKVQMPVAPSTAKRAASPPEGSEPPRKKSRQDVDGNPQHRRELSTLSEAASWINTPEPQGGRSTATATIDQPVKDRPQGGAFTSAAKNVNATSTLSNAYRQRGASSAAGPSTATAARPANPPSKLRRKSKDKKPFALAATIYTPIPVLTESHSSNFCGVIVSYRLPTKAHYGSGDYNMNINMIDQWCYNSADRLSLNLFARQGEDLPGHIAEGMVLLIRQVRIRHFNGKLSGTVFKDKLAWATLSQSGDYRQLTGVIVHRQEREHMQELSRWYAETYLNQQANGAAQVDAETVGVVAAVTQNLKRTITLDQLQDGVFCHCIAEVVRVYAKPDRPEIYITDWTSHDQLDIVNNKDIGWTQEEIDRFVQNRSDKGGGSVLKITLWDEQVNAVLALTPGTMVHIKNLRCKRSGLEMLEGSIGGARTQREFKENKWQIQKLRKSDPLLASLLKRKADAVEALKMERMMSWPDSGESAEKVKEEAKSPAAGTSCNAQLPESATTADNSTKSNTSADKLVQDRANAAPANAQSADPSGEAAENGDEDPEVRMQRLTDRAAEMRATLGGAPPAAPGAPAQPSQTQSDTASSIYQPPANPVDKGKCRAIDPPSTNNTDHHSTQHSTMSTLSSPAVPIMALMPPPPLPFIADDETTSGEGMQPSMDDRWPSTMTHSGTPSIMYSMPPPGQRPPAVQAPPSSYPSASQVEVQQPPPPLTSTPFAQPTAQEKADNAAVLDVHGIEDDDTDFGSSQDEDEAKKAAAEARALKKRLAQEKADQAVLCNLANLKVSKLSDLAKGVRINDNSHVCGRVVDIIPKKPSRWVKVRCKSCNRTLPDTDHFCAPCADEEGSQLVYEWLFALVLQEDGEDAPFESLPLIVTGPSGNAFLPEFDPAKHRRGVKSCRKLYERMASVFGFSKHRIAAVLEADLGVRLPAEDDKKSAAGASAGDEDDVELQPLLHFGVYTYRMPPIPGNPAETEGKIKCRIIQTPLKLKNKPRQS
ncbi:hypothetical protein V8E36_002362 [Tilletia maclaganii]